MTLKPASYLVSAITAEVLQQGGVWLARVWLTYAYNCNYASAEQDKPVLVYEYGHESEDSAEADAIAKAIAASRDVTV